jgi:hypothetical protein
MRIVSRSSASITSFRSSGSSRHQHKNWVVVNEFTNH